MFILQICLFLIGSILLFSRFRFRPLKIKIIPNYLFHSYLHSVNNRYDKNHYLLRLDRGDSKC
jgi:hypothetical protein